MYICLNSRTAQSLLELTINIMMEKQKWARMSCCECCVLSARGLCYKVINRPEESYRLLCVIKCDLETS